MCNSLLIVALAGLCACAYGEMRVQERGELIFEDTFEFLNFDKWQHEITAGGGGNWEFQYYTNNRSNSYVRDNTLYIKPTLAEDKFGEGFISSGVLKLWGATSADLCTGNNWFGCERSAGGTNYLNSIQSASLRSVHSFALKYGTLEVIAQMPKGDWIRPAIWLLPKHNPYGEWPASGEIDLAACRGEKPRDSPWAISIIIAEKMNLPGNQTFGDDFHNFTLQWTSEGMTFFLDGRVILVVDPGDGFWDKGEFGISNPGIANPWITSPNKIAPFDQEFYIIMNVATGGMEYFSDEDINIPQAKPWTNDSPQAAKDFYDAKDNWYPTWNAGVNNGEDAAMKVKSVRAWALPTDGNSFSHQLRPSLVYTIASLSLTLFGIAGRRM